MKAYTLEQLRYFRDIRYLGFDRRNEHQDDVFITPSEMFDEQTEIFIEWLERMEKKGKLVYFLQDERTKKAVHNMLNPNKQTDEKCSVCNDKKMHTFLKELHGYLCCVLCLPFYKGMTKKQFEEELANL